MIMRAFAVWVFIVLLAVVNGGNPRDIYQSELATPQHDRHGHALRRDFRAVLGHDRMDQAEHDS